MADTVRETVIQLAVTTERVSELREKITEALADPGEWVPVEREVAERLGTILDRMMAKED